MFPVTFQIVQSEFETLSILLLDKSGDFMLQARIVLQEVADFDPAIHD